MARNFVKIKKSFSRKRPSAAAKTGRHRLSGSLPEKKTVGPSWGKNSGAATGVPRITIYDTFITTYVTPLLTRDTGANCSQTHRIPTRNNVETGAIVTTGKIQQYYTKRYRFRRTTRRSEQHSGPLYRYAERHFPERFKMAGTRWKRDNDDVFVAVFRDPNGAQ